MSNRAMRRILELNKSKNQSVDLDEEVEEEEDEEEEEEEGVYSTKTKARNAFDLLGEEGETAQNEAKGKKNKKKGNQKNIDKGKEIEKDVDKLVEGNESDNNDNNNNNNNNNNNSNSNNSNGIKKKKKSKKKGKGKGVESNTDSVNDNNNNKNDHENKIEREITEEVKKIEINPKFYSSRGILKIDPKRLNPDSELRKLFGGLLTRSDIDSVNRSYAKGSTSSGKTKARQYHKKYMLIPAKTEWPPVYGGISMEYVGKKESKHFFKIVWSQNYMLMQQEFLALLSTHDPLSIQTLLVVNPYHVDTLLQLSQVCLQSGDYQTANDLVERCVFAYESTFHSLFLPYLLGGTEVVRVDYDVPENNSFFLTLFRYIQILGRRGCPRTALEFCKILLSLDISDPLYVSLIIDYYSLKSKEYLYLLELFYTSEKWIELPLGAMPNFRYSIALASFMLEKNTTTTSTTTTSPSSFPIEKLPPSNVLLEEAILMFPSVLPALAKKLGKDLPAIVNQQPYFTQSQPHSLEHLVTLFVERNHALWNQPEVFSWLKSTILDMIPKIDAGFFSNQIAEYVNVISTQYKIPPHTFQHLLLSEYADAISSLPPEIAEAYRGALGVPQAPQGRRIVVNPNVGQEEDFIYEDGMFENPQIPLPTTNPLALFLRTLMPWAPIPNVGVEQNHDQLEDADEDDENDH